MKSFIISIVFLVLGGFVIGVGVYGATTDGVTATVTAQNISVTVTDGIVAYSTLALAGATRTTSSGLNDSQAATNDGNITEVFNIRTQDSLTAGGAWQSGATGSL
ncbi:MAG: hypothetical protein AABZ36_08975, partial [Nitrospirota bacterium]